MITKPCRDCDGLGCVGYATGCQFDDTTLTEVCLTCAGTGSVEDDGAPLGRCGCCNLVSPLVVVYCGKPVCEDCGSSLFGVEPETARVDVAKVQLVRVAKAAS